MYQAPLLRDNYFGVQYGISRRPDPKHDRNPPQIGQTKFGETAVHFCTDTHEDVGPTVVDRR